MATSSSAALLSALLVLLCASASGAAAPAPIAADAINSTSAKNPFHGLVLEPTLSAITAIVKGDADLVAKLNKPMDGSGFVPNNPVWIAFF